MDANELIKNDPQVLSTGAAVGGALKLTHAQRPYSDLQQKSLRNAYGTVFASIGLADNSSCWRRPRTW